MVRATGQSGTQPAATQAVVNRLPGPAILDEHDILERAADHFRLRTPGDLDAVVAAQMPPPPPLPSLPPVPPGPAAARP